MAHEIEELCRSVEHTSNSNRARFIFIAIMQNTLSPEMLVDPFTGHLRKKQELCWHISNTVHNDIQYTTTLAQKAKALQGVATVTMFADIARGKDPADLNIDRLAGIHQQPQFATRLQQAERNIHRNMNIEHRLGRSDLPDSTGDTHLTDLCKQAVKQHMTLVEFRKYVLQSPRRFFQGKHIKVRHLFRPDGSPRSSITEICWAIRILGFQRFFGIFGQ